MESSEGLAIPKEIRKQGSMHPPPQFAATYSTTVKKKNRQDDVYLKERRQTTAYPQITHDHKAMI